jgi:hypothetical protein
MTALGIRAVGMVPIVGSKDRYYRKTPTDIGRQFLPRIPSAENPGLKTSKLPDNIRQLALFWLCSQLTLVWHPRHGRPVNSSFALTGIV